MLRATFKNLLLLLLFIGAGLLLIFATSEEPTYAQSKAVYYSFVEWREDGTARVQFVIDVPIELESEYPFSTVVK